jgi:hypothetical protein
VTTETDPAVVTVCGSEGAAKNKSPSQSCVSAGAKLFRSAAIEADSSAGVKRKPRPVGELTGAGLVVREGDVQPSHTTTQAADSPVKSNGKPRPLVSDREMSQLNKSPGQWVS